MSLKKRRQLKKEAKLSASKQAIADRTGMLFSGALSGKSERLPLVKFAVNAIALFCATFGTLYCVITSFELDVNIMPMLFTTALVSLIFAFMYLSQKAKICVYLAVLFAIIFGGTRYYIIINTGISAIRNNILKFIDKTSPLPFLKEYTLLFNDEFTAMSITFCILAVALALFLNIFISEKMTFIAVFLITFPIIQLGMYFDLTPAKSAMLCVATGWILIAVVNFTGSYNGLDIKMKGVSKIKGKTHTYSFVTDSKNVANIALLVLSFALVVSGVVFSALPDDDFQLDIKTNSFKQSTERVVKNFLSYGLGSMLSPESSGSDPGALSNTAEIAFDGKADLQVKLVNYRVNRVYLKSFTGYDYDASSLKWLPRGNFNEIDADSITTELLKNDFEGNKTVCGSKHKIGVKIIDNTLYRQPLNVPYYSEINEPLTYEGAGIVNAPGYSIKSDFIYYTTYTADYDLTDKTDLPGEITDEGAKDRLTLPLAVAKADAYQNAMNVPENNLDAIKQFCKENNISPSDPNKVKKVISALEENFEYTLRPGKIPYGEDYINYFLLANKKGYCQHFASAATLIFRYLGVPARYAEGYAINRTDFFGLEGDPDEDWQDWIDANYLTGKEVITLDVSDRFGHAWCEVYVEGFGWQVVEATTAAAAEQRRSLISTLFGSVGTFSGDSTGLAEAVRKMNVEKTKNSLGFLAYAVIAAIVLILLLKIAIIKIKRFARLHTKNKRNNLKARYNLIYDNAFLVFGLKAQLTYRDFFALLGQKEILSHDEAEGINALLSSALFSGEVLSDETYSALTKQMKKLRLALVKRAKLSTKINIITR